MLKQQFNLKLQQKLSPIQIQTIKMLEYPSLELEERIRQEIIDNPALETGIDDISEAEDVSVWGDDAMAESEQKKDKEETLDSSWEIDDNYDDSSHYYQNSWDNNSEQSSYVKDISGNDSFLEVLRQQLRISLVSDYIKGIAEYVIGNLNADGYLHRTNEQMIDDLVMLYGEAVTEEDMKTTVELLQSFEPAGVAARSLQECLLLQLKNIKSDSNVDLAINIVENCFELLGKGSNELIAKKLNADTELVLAALDQIKRLNPKPGNAYGTSSETLAQVIAPDFRVENINGELCVELITVNIPNLRVSKDYKNMVEDFVGNKQNQTKQAKEAILFARQKIDAARWFIDAIKQRNNTLIQTMTTIVEMQREFFLSGDETLIRPMRLKDVADKIGYDISTISRVSNSKYVESEWGILSLKYFFSESMQTANGEEVSSKAIKQTIKQIIEEEDKENPITDDEIAAKLNVLGYIVARRTVAKYREQLKIATSRERKARI